MKWCMICDSGKFRNGLIIPGWKERGRILKAEFSPIR